MSKKAVIIIILAILVGAGVYWWQKEFKKDCGAQLPMLCPGGSELTCINGKWQCNSVDQTAGWQTYRNEFYKDYEIKYPLGLTLTEKGQNNRAAVLVSKNYKLNMANGLLEGFKINIFVNNYDSVNNLDDLFRCNNESNIFNCLLADVNLLLDYKNGSIKKENLSIDEYPAVKYDFVSNNDRNNNIGIVAKKDNEFYIVTITYRDEKNIELFNQILSTFKFTK